MQSLALPSQTSLLLSLLNMMHQEKLYIGASRRETEEEYSVSLITFPALSWVEDLEAAYASEEQLLNLINQCRENQLPLEYYMNGGLFLYNNMLYIPNQEELRTKVLELMHNSPWGGHTGYAKTIYKIMRDLYWLGLKKNVKPFIINCDLCQRVKVDNTLLSGCCNRFLFDPFQPLTHITMHFIEGLPNSNGLKSLWVVVDRITKYNHFSPLKYP